MIWFTSDTHFNHRHILRYCNRNFSSIEEMNNHIIDNINRLVKPSDMLCHLGDFAFKDTKSLRSRILCKNIRLVLGNHCRESLSLYREVFTTVNQIDRVKYQDSEFILCHYPMVSWNKMHHGTYHLYGHCHSNAEDNLNTLFPARRSIDVGVDNAFKFLGEYRPFSVDDVLGVLYNRLGHSVDHHMGE